MFILGILKKEKKEERQISLDV